LDQYNKRDTYVLYRVDATTFFVKEKICRTFTSDWKIRNFWKYLVPSFERTRIVRIVEQDSKRYLVCSSGYFERNGLANATMYKVLQRTPEATDVAVRWHKGYRYYYQKEGFEEISAIYDTAIDNEVPGPQIDYTVFDSWPVKEGEKHLSFLEETLPTSTPKVGGGTYWASNDGASNIEATNTQNVVPQHQLATMPQFQQQLSLSHEASGDFLDGNDDDANSFGHDDNDDDHNSFEHDDNDREPRMSAFKANMPLYQTLSNLADSNVNMRKHFQSSLRRMQTELLAMAIERKRNDAVVAPAEFVSLPQTERSRCARPYGSQETRKRGRNSYK
jgi:hypothetical protein